MDPHDPGEHIRRGLSCQKGSMTMERIKPRTLSGFMELLPRGQAQFEKVRSVIEDTYRR